MPRAPPLHDGRKRHADSPPPHRRTKPNTSAAENGTAATGLDRIMWDKFVRSLEPSKGQRAPRTQKTPAHVLLAATYPNEKRLWFRLWAANNCKWDEIASKATSTSQRTEDNEDHNVSRCIVMNAIAKCHATILYELIRAPPPLKEQWEQRLRGHEDALKELRASLDDVRDEAPSLETVRRYEADAEACKDAIYPSKSDGATKELSP